MAGIPKRLRGYHRGYAVYYPEYSEELLLACLLECGAKLIDARTPADYFHWMEKIKGFYLRQRGHVPEWELHDFSNQFKGWVRRGGYGSLPD